MKTPFELWIDAADFPEKGGWKEDSQFVHLMGGRMLIAADEPGVPVEDARTLFEIPEEGYYRFWVYDRNWLRSHSPGRFKLLIDGEETANILGQMPSDRWLWEIGGDVKLEKGSHTLSLHDLTGYFGRCAFILITDDMDSVPSREIDRLHAERARIKGLDHDIADGGFYDVIVAGGGPAGVPAAIAAAREGSKTLLLQDRPMLGGNASDEIGITMDGAEVSHMFARESGIAEEIRVLRDRDPSFIGDYSRAMAKLTAEEKNLTVLCNQHVSGAETDGASRIKSIYSVDQNDLSRHRYEGSFFIDCTGDGWLGYYAGAKYRFGREASWQHGEDIAPVQPDTLTMSGCLKSGNRPYFVKSDTPVEYHAPEWVPQLPTTDREFARAINGDGGSVMWWIETWNAYDDMWDAEETRDALLLVLLGYYDHIKNYWSKKERAQNLRLRMPAVWFGRRESRRLIGDYILTQADCTNGAAFEDAISYAGWSVDVHNPKGIYSGAEGPMYCARHVPMSQIPYRCLYSRNIENLLFAGRNISTTHIAVGTVRVENTIATLGQAAGTAAGMCVNLNETPRGIYERHMKDLQQLLIKNDQFIPGVKNEDPADPCLNAETKASSVKPLEIFPTLKGIDGEFLPLDTARRTNLSAACPDGAVDGIYVKLNSASSVPTTVTAHATITGTSHFGESVSNEIYTVEATVPPLGVSWVRLPFFIPLPNDKMMDRRQMQLWIDPAEGISWQEATHQTFYQIAGYQRPDGTWKNSAHVSMRASFKKPEEVPANCGPENTVNGYSRIISAENYEWVSDPACEMPQWIEVRFPKETDISSVSLAFDTDLTNPGTYWHAESKKQGDPRCVKDYAVEVFSKGNWVRIADEKGNFRRKRTHTFDEMPAEKIRLTVFATWGDKSARVMEIRAE